MIRTELSKHPVAYAILCIGLVSGVVSFLIAWPDHFLQRMVIVALCGFYVLWGVVTHHVANTRTAKTVLEYLGMSLLGGTLLFFLTL